MDALERVLVSAWEQLAEHDAVAGAAAAELGTEAMRRAHGSVRTQLLELARRGQEEGAFRADVDADWLVTACLALMHAAADERRAGRMTEEESRTAAATSARGLWRGVA